jgi:hypothetical protein
VIGIEAHQKGADELHLIPSTVNILFLKVSPLEWVLGQLFEESDDGVAGARRQADDTIHDLAVDEDRIRLHSQPFGFE